MTSSAFQFLHFLHELKESPPLINEVIHKLNKSVKISTGLGVALGFQPLVKISQGVKQQKDVTLLKEEWSELLQHLPRFEEHLKSKSSRCVHCETEEVTYPKIVICNGEINLIFLESKGKCKVKNVRNQHEVELDKTMFLKLEELINFVDYRLKRLETLDFLAYYNQITEFIAADKPDDKDLISYGHELVAGSVGVEDGSLTLYSERVDCILEVLSLHGDKIKCDVGKIKCRF